MTLKEIFQSAIDNKASDIHLLVNKPPILRIDGKLVSLKDIQELSKEYVNSLIGEILSDEQKDKFHEQKEIDTSYETDDNSRFRVNCFFEKGNPGMVARLVPGIIPTIEELGLPKIVKELAGQKQGLVLVTGPTGCGKSTSLAAILNQINLERAVNIVTLEDPIEFVYKAEKSIIKQRQVGSDTTSFEEGLRRMLRQDPDVIMVGEMRDLETIAATLTLAETGHLVFATLHTNNAAQTIDRIIDVFPAHQQAQIRVQLSLVLSGVIAQQLIPKKGGGRIAAREIMLNTPAVSNLIRENKVSQIKSIIQTSADHEMITIEQDLENLVKQGLVDEDVAKMYVIDGRVA